MESHPSSSFTAFWPHYVLAHRRPLTRAFHFVCTLLEIALLSAFLSSGRWMWLVALPVVCYGLAWFSHIAFEKNRPATWSHPFYSWLADHKMFALMLTGRMTDEVERVRHDFAPRSRGEPVGSRPTGSR